MNKVVVYAGSFDPITLGHLDVIIRASRNFDQVVVGIGTNSSKTSSFFLPGDRKSLIQEVCTDRGLENVRVEIFTGLTVDFCRTQKASIIIRGLRCGSEFESEINIAHTNAALAPEIDTLFIGTSPGQSFVSSSMVRDVAKNKGDITQFVPGCVAKAMQRKLAGS